MTMTIMINGHIVLNVFDDIDVDKDVFFIVVITIFCGLFLISVLQL